MTWRFASLVFLLSVFLLHANSNEEAPRLCHGSEVPAVASSPASLGLAQLPDDGSSPQHTLSILEAGKEAGSAAPVPIDESAYAHEGGGEEAGVGELALVIAGELRPKAVHNATEIPAAAFKKRVNFASASCGAKILGANPEADDPSNILMGAEDRYLLNSCERDKWVAVELCEEVMIDTVRFGNLEYFSSIPRAVDLYSSRTAAALDEDWSFIATLVAPNERQINSFLLDRPVWARFLKLHFVSHYGKKKLCPITLLAVYGMTPTQDLEFGLHLDDLEVSEFSRSLDSLPELAQLLASSDSPHELMLIQSPFIDQVQAQAQVQLPQPVPTTFSHYNNNSPCRELTVCPCHGPVALFERPFSPSCLLHQAAENTTCHHHSAPPEPILEAPVCPLLPLAPLRLFQGPSEIRFCPLSLPPLLPSPPRNATVGPLLDPFSHDQVQTLVQHGGAQGSNRASSTPHDDRGMCPNPSVWELFNSPSQRNASIALESNTSASIGIVCGEQVPDGNSLPNPLPNSLSITGKEHSESQRTGSDVVSSSSNNQLNNNVGSSSSPHHSVLKTLAEKIKGLQMNTTVNTKSLDKLANTTHAAISSALKAIEVCQSEVAELKGTVFKLNGARASDPVAMISDLQKVKSELETSILLLNDRLTAVETLYLQRLIVAFIGAVLLTATCTYLLSQIPNPWALRPQL
ncbi:MAG: hypothetical protein Q8P67_19555 [archaeon]|nr:hypothetical protein [archaeon]